MTRLRKVVAERAVASMQQTAQLTTVVEVDVTRVAQLRDKVKGEFQQKTGQKLSFLPFFALAAVEALQAYPIINSTVDGDSIVYPGHENLSIAVDTERGLLTPVIKDAAALDLAGFAAQIADLAGRTRDNKLKPDELAGGTFTLTNTGSRGALFDTPVVFLPQSAILGTGIVVKKPARRQPGRRRRHRHPVDRLPRPVVRSPHRRRCGRRSLPHRGQEPPRGRRLRGRPRHLGFSPRTPRASAIRPRPSSEGARPVSFPPSAPGTETMAASPVRPLRVIPSAGGSCAGYAADRPASDDRPHRAATRPGRRSSRQSALLRLEARVPDRQERACRSNRIIRLDGGIGRRAAGIE